MEKSILNSAFYKNKTRIKHNQNPLECSLFNTGIEGKGHIISNNPESFLDLEGKYTRMEED